MSLTVSALNAAKPATKPYKLFDGKGLYLSVQPSGTKVWRLKYRFDGKEKKLALGAYPEIGLKDARAQRDATKSLLAAGTDPGVQKRLEKLERAYRSANTFRAVAEEYLGKRERDGLAEVTISKSRWLLGMLAPAIGTRPITEISARELLSAIKRIEAKGHYETARRMRSLAGRIFRYAIATGWAERDVSVDLRDALTVPTVSHRAAILDPVRVGDLLRAIEAYGGQPSTRFALQLAPHVFVRPGELRYAEWEEINFDKKIWTIPGGKTKMGKDHHVPLSFQAVGILLNAQNLSGGKRHLFPSCNSSVRPISENTLNSALRRMKFSADEMTAHGFRAMASTLLNESGKWNPDAIERALAHGQVNSVRAAYHRGAYWDERVQMMQWWSNRLDSLRDGAEIIAFRNEA